MSNPLTQVLLLMQIHERIRTFRLAKNYTQEYMSEQLKIDVANYGKLERGITKITLERIEKIAKVLEVDMHELLGISSNANQEEQVFKEKTNVLLENILNEIKMINQKL